MIEFFVDTPVGLMRALADRQKLFCLEFTERGRIEGNNLEEPITCLVKKELADYFAGTLRQFTIPLNLEGSPFQLQCWQALITLPYGETRSYKQQAEAIGNSRSVRAVGSANGRNKISVIIPCHRIINHNGDLGGYGGGLHRKKWLLEHEARYK